MPRNPRIVRSPDPVPVIGSTHKDFDFSEAFHRQSHDVWNELFTGLKTGDLVYVNIFLTKKVD